MNNKSVQLNEEVRKYFSFNILKRDTFELKSGKSSDWHGVRAVSSWSARIGYCSQFGDFEISIPDFDTLVNIVKYKDGEDFIIKYDIIPNKHHHTFYYLHERAHTHFGVDWIDYFATYICSNFVLRFEGRKLYIIRKDRVDIDMPKKEKKYRIFVPEYIRDFLIAGGIQSAIMSRSETIFNTQKQKR